MPIYEYTCSDCGARFDALRTMKDSDKELECTRCHSSHTHRVQSACFSQSSSSVISSSGSGCAGCSGGSCSSCGH
ncbi:MAG: zinc ribbon domain-containing protein [Anaerolineaceae bacterium]